MIEKRNGESFCETVFVYTFNFVWQERVMQDIK